MPRTSLRDGGEAARTSARQADLDVHVEGFRLPSLRPRELVLLCCLPLSVVVALAGLSLTGELAPRLLMDPGAVVRYGLPVARVVHDAAAALTIGLLVLAVGFRFAFNLVLPPDNPFAITVIGP